MKKGNRALAFLFLVLPFCSFAGLDPSRLSIKVYSTYVSTSTYCTDFNLLFESITTDYKDLVNIPILGTLDNTGGAYNGTFPCLVFKISERFQFVPAFNSGGCAEGTVYTSDLCPDGTVTTAVDGSTSTCAANTEDIVYLYLSTTSTATTLSTGINPFSPPSASNNQNGLALGSAFSIRGGAAGRFIVNTTGKITSTGLGNCTLNFPEISFTLQ